MIGVIEKNEAIQALEKITRKSRVHFYKPIQIAEILHRDRVHGDIDLIDRESYRNRSKLWRDEVSIRLVGRVSTSSQKFQDDLFNENAMPPRLLSVLGEMNSGGYVERLVYDCFSERFSQMRNALDYCEKSGVENFDPNFFLNLFRNDPGLRRSVDKVYESVVYAFFSALIKAMGLVISVKITDPNAEIFQNFSDFSEKILGTTSDRLRCEYPAKLFRVGVTNAADRGLDMWGNFGLAIQIKHLSLNEEMARSVSGAVDADRIIIVCRDADEPVIASVLRQLGWGGKIQAIVTAGELDKWYKRALSTKSAPPLGEEILTTLSDQIKSEFPSVATGELRSFFQERGYSSGVCLA